MRIACGVTGVLLAMAVFATGLRADEAAIRGFMRTYLDAFNTEDLEAVSGMWTEDATHVDRITGNRTETRESIRADLAEVFADNASTRLQGTVDRIRWVRPDVAVVEGTTTTTVPDAEPSVSQYSAIVVKQGDAWKFDSIEEMGLPRPATAHDALQDLAWFVGTWVDDSQESPVYSSLRWSASGTYLLRSFSTLRGDENVALGTQIIAWDPRAQAIRSWIFNADGTFGDGVWAKVDDSWMVKSTQTLADGRAASGTYVLTPVDDGQVTVRLIGHEIEGQPQETADPVSFRRIEDSQDAPAEPTE